MNKRIITWKWGNNETHDEFTSSRAFIFDDYEDNLEHYNQIGKELMRDFPEIEEREIQVGVVRKSSYMKGFVYVSAEVESGVSKEGYEQWERFDFD